MSVRVRTFWRCRAALPALTAFLGCAAVLVGCTTGGQDRSAPTVSVSSGPSTVAAPGGTSTGTVPVSPSTSAANTSAPPKPAAKPVHIQLKFSDGQTFGIGIPVIAYISRKITDATALQNATTVTVNGNKITGGHWYFEPLSGHPGYPIEGDYRLENPWRAHSKIFVDIPVKGLPAGAGLVYDDSLTSSFSTGAAQIATVYNSTHTLTLTVDGRVEGKYPVSLGAANTPTRNGIKVIMEKVKTVCMHDTAGSYYECGIKEDQRLTYDGEYLHSAPWNCASGRSPGCVGPQNNIGSADSSNGCTNLLPADATKLYGILRVGDIVKFPDATGPRMTMGEGYGDWNVSWAQWLTGGDVQKI